MQFKWSTGFVFFLSLPYKQLQQDINELSADSQAGRLLRSANTWRPQLQRPPAPLALSHHLLFPQPSSSSHPPAVPTELEQSDGDTKTIEHARRTFPHPVSTFSTRHQLSWKAWFSATQPTPPITIILLHTRTSQRLSAETTTEIPEKAPWGELPGVLFLDIQNETMLPVQRTLSAPRALDKSARQVSAVFTHLWHTAAGGIPPV